MTNKLFSGVAHRRPLVIWTLFCIIAGATFLAYTLSSLANGHGEFVMPLDDVYIHFQYARQMAAGQPYVYNPGLPATSGATSFLYPFVLAFGYLIGFQGLKLGLWAMAVGGLAMVGSMWLIYKLIRLLCAQDWVAVLVAVAFGISGPVAWHYVSGMETGLVMLLTLGTLYAVLRLVLDGHEGRRVSYVPFVVWATALALIRPEGGVFAVVAVAVVWWMGRKTQGIVNEGFASGKPLRRWIRISLLVPVLAVGVQPLVNWIFTGSAVASGNAAKSILGTVPFYWDDVIRRIVGNFVQMWAEFGTGISPREGLYIMPLMLVLALVGIGWLLVERKLRIVGVMLVLWFVGVSAMLATLDTVFWHFKRYQMPLMALLFPLAGWGIGVVASYKRQATREEIIEPQSPYEITPHPKMKIVHPEPPPQPSPASDGGSKTGLLAGYFQSRHREIREEIEPPRRQEFSFIRQENSSVLAKAFMYLFVGGMLIAGAFTGVQFWRYYGLNVGYVYAQPLQMARWLKTNTPENAVIAVHDVGMMRYMGGRTTLDIVGLTTKGAADYWRNGPGAVAEFLMKEKPDYIASYGYGHGYGLGMIADTDIYGKPLASFPVELDDHANVALAANFQGIYKPDWMFSTNTYKPLQPNMFSERSLVMGRVNVGDITSEQDAHYSWLNSERLSGFATEVHEFEYLKCFLENCKVIDGGRLISGEESFDLFTGMDSGDYYPMALVTRLHPQTAGTIDIYADGTFVGTRWIPSIPGKWLEVSTCIPAAIMGNAYSTFGGGQINIRIVPHIPNGYYMPYYHWLSGCPPEGKMPDNPQSTFQNGAIQLGSTELDYQPDSAKLDVNFEWYTDGSAKGDYKVFVHLYDDVNKAPVAQMDTRPGNGTLPPGNWLPGVLHDTITVDLKGVAAGTYKVAIGMYDPVTFERLQPTGGDEQGRLFIGEVVIKG